MKRSETAAAELLILIPALNRYGLPGITAVLYAFHGTYGTYGTMVPLVPACTSKYLLVSDTGRPKYYYRVHSSKRNY